MRAFAIRFALSLLCAAIVYRDAPSTFFRAESGLFLSWSHAGETQRDEFVRTFIRHSYGGHYTPLFFLAEFETAKLAGTQRTFWRARQIFAVALLGAVSMLALERMAGAFALRKREGISIAAAVTALAVFQPLMIDLVAWPFMLAQLLWAILLMLSFYAMLRVIETPRDKKWPWIVAVAAYFSMHASGLGAVTVAAVAASLGFLFLARRLEVVRPLITLLVFAAVHAFAMIYLLPRDNGSHAGPTFHSVAALKLVLGFVVYFFWAALRGFSLTIAPPPDVVAIAYCWSLGLLLIVLITTALWKVARSAIARRVSATLTQTTVLIFSAVGFFALVLLITLREIAEARASAGLVPFFNAFTVMPRYTIPLQWLFVGAFALAVIHVALHARHFTVWTCNGIVIAAMIANLEFQRTAMQNVMPTTRISHRAAWHLVLEVARQSRAANLPVPNLQLAAITEEFNNMDVESFLPLIGQELGLRADEKLRLIDSAVADEDERYRAVPSLKKLERMLNLLPPEHAAP